MKITCTGEESQFYRSHVMVRSAVQRLLFDLPNMARDGQRVKASLCSRLIKNKMYYTVVARFYC